MKELYLKEDQDILGLLETHSGTSVDEKALINKQQIQAILRNRKSLEDANKETQRFSRVLFVVSLLQLVIATFQFGFNVIDSKNIWIGVILLFVFVWLMYWAFKNSKI